MSPDPRIADLTKRITELEQLTRDLRSAIASMPCIAHGSEQHRQKCEHADQCKAGGCGCNKRV